MPYNLYTDYVGRRCTKLEMYAQNRVHTASKGILQCESVLPFFLDFSRLKKITTLVQNSCNQFKTSFDSSKINK
jgi:hypothetical protein